MPQFESNNTKYLRNLTTEKRYRLFYCFAELFILDVYSYRWMNNNTSFN